LDSGLPAAVEDGENPDVLIFPSGTDSKLPSHGEEPLAVVPFQPVPLDNNPFENGGAGFRAVSGSPAILAAADGHLLDEGADLLGRAEARA
jgi:hypothetical protein